MCDEAYRLLTFFCILNALSLVFSPSQHSNYEFENSSISECRVEIAYRTSSQRKSGNLIKGSGGVRLLHFSSNSVFYETDKLVIQSSFHS